MKLLINSSKISLLSENQQRNCKGGAGACGAAEIFFPNNPVLNDIANTVVHWWETKGKAKVGK
ncbi:MAG: hypothetical protein R3E32_00170 [Chitinophagales bacterium]